MHFVNKILAASILVLYLSGLAAAEDKLKPFIDEGCKLLKAAAGKLSDVFFSFFPSMRDSLSRMVKSMDEKLPFMKDFHWVFYLTVFIAVMVVLSRLWGASRRYVINSVVGIILLLILNHLLDVGIEITLLTLIIVALFGVPGVLFTLIMHYCGIII